MSIPVGVDLSAPVLAHHEIHVDAPLATAWERLIDVNGWTVWNPEMTSAHLDGDFAPGASFEWESYEFPVISTIYHVEPHRRILWGGIANGITGIHEWLFTADSRGVHIQTNESFAGAPVEADEAGMQALLDGSLTTWLSRIKAAAEQPSTR